jgi:hypothetical protein
MTGSRPGVDSAKSPCRRPGPNGHFAKIAGHRDRCAEIWDTAGTEAGQVAKSGASSTG